MQSIALPCLDALIRRLDDAFDASSHPAELVRDALVASYQNNEIVLPTSLHTWQSHRYARRLLHHCPRRGYALIAMTWGPGQSAALHGHHGEWCAECIWQGQIHITRYDFVGQEDTAYCFSMASEEVASAGDTDILIAPSEFHTMRNPSNETPTISLHVYPQIHTKGHWFELLSGNRYQKHACDIPLDDIF